MKSSSKWWWVGQAQAPLTDRGPGSDWASPSCLNLGRGPSTSESCETRVCGEVGPPPQRSVHGGWDSGLGLHARAGALSCPLAGCEAPLNCSLFFHQMGPQPRVPQGCLRCGEEMGPDEGPSPE